MGNDKEMPRQRDGEDLADYLKRRNEELFGSSYPCQSDERSSIFWGIVLYAIFIGLCLLYAKQTYRAPAESYPGQREYETIPDSAFGTWRGDYWPED